MDGGGSTTTTTQNYSPEESAQRAKVMAEAARIYKANAATMANSPYPGQQVTPFSPETLTSQNYAIQYALGPGLQQANNINQAVQFGLNDVLYPQTNPALQSTINAAIRPITESYTDSGGVMSQIRDAAMQTGQFGSSRQGIAQGIAAGRYADAIGDAAAKISTEGYNKGLDTFSRTLAFAPQAIEAGMLPANVLSSVGLQNEQLAGEIEAYKAAERMWGLNAPWTPLQNYASIVFGGANPTSVTSSQAQTSPLQTLGSLGSLALMAKLLLPSDRRLKDNIKWIDVDEKTGLNIYEFTYKTDPGKHYRGVLADEVRKVYPAAVVTDSDGYLAVDYDKLGIEFKQLD